MKLTRGQWLLLKGAEKGEMVSHYMLSSRGCEYAWAVPKGSTGTDANVCIRLGLLEHDKNTKGYGRGSDYRLSAEGKKLLAQTAEPDPPEVKKAWCWRYGKLDTCEVVKRGNTWFRVDYGTKLEKGWHFSRQQALENALRLCQSAIDYAEIEKAAIRKILDEKQ